jgi:tripartite-type tricarboxylate transporter receptor subunit TctC
MCMRTLSRSLARLGLLCIAILAAPVCAQEYPSKAVRIIVSFAPGGPDDLSVRPVAQKLQEILGQPFVIDYRAGANASLVLNTSRNRRRMDTRCSSSHLRLRSTQVLTPKLPFDPVRDLTPVSSIAVSDIVFLVNPTVPARTVKEFVALTKSRPSKLTYGSSGSGGSLHLGGERTSIWCTCPTRARHWRSPM